MRERAGRGPNPNPSMCPRAQVEDLKRFMPQLLHVVRPGARAAAAHFPNVSAAASLAAAFGAS